MSSWSDVLRKTPSATQSSSSSSSKQQKQDTGFPSLPSQKKAPSTPAQQPAEKKTAPPKAPKAEVAKPAKPAQAPAQAKPQSPSSPVFVTPNEAATPGSKNLTKTIQVSAKTTIEPEAKGNISSAKTPQQKQQIIEKWKKEQLELKKQLIAKDDFDWKISTTPATAATATSSTPVKQLQYVAGVDISFSRIDSDNAVASLVILSYPDLKVVHEQYKQVRMMEPYIAGFLAFREVPYLLELVNDVKKNFAHLTPQVIIVDGNGVLHQRGFGLACQLGVITGIPCIGIAKKLLHVGGINEPMVRQLVKTKLFKRGDYQLLRSPQSHNTVYGAVIKTSNANTVLPAPTSGFAASQKVVESFYDEETGEYYDEEIDQSVNMYDIIYCSVGHKISLDTAIAVVRACCIGNKLPEPTFLADKLSRDFIRTNIDKSLQNKRGAPYKKSNTRRQYN